MVEAKSLSSITLIKKNICDFNEAVNAIITNLDEHAKNLEKIDKAGDSKALRRETVKCCNTIKKLDNLLKDLISFKDSVTWDSLSEANHLRNEISMLELRIVHSRDSFANLIDRKIILNSPTQQELVTQEKHPSTENGQLQLQAQIEEDIKAKKHICESYLQLQRNIQDLNETIQTFADLVSHQGELVDSIESNIENTVVHVNSGVRDLSKAAKFKRAMLPVTSAFLGGCVGGPVGVVLGVKVGICTAIGSALISYGGAKIVQKKVLKDVAETESQIAKNDVNNVKKEN